MGDATATERLWCSVGGCRKPSERNVEGVGPLCAGHRKRLLRLRHGTSTLPLEDPALGELSPLEEAIVAADRFLDASAEDDREYAERLEQFRIAVLRWIRTTRFRRTRRPAEAVGEQAAAAPPAAPEPSGHPLGGLAPLPGRPRRHLRVRSALGR